MPLHRNTPYGSLKTIFHWANSEDEFVLWFLPVRTQMVRIGLCLLAAMLLTLSLLSYLSIEQGNTMALMFLLSAVFCLVLYFSFSKVNSAIRFDLLVSIGICAIAIALFLGFWDTKNFSGLYAMTFSVILVWVGALSGLSFFSTAIVSSLIVLMFGFGLSFAGQIEYALMLGVFFSALLGMFFSYFKESQLRQAYIGLAGLRQSPGSNMDQGGRPVTQRKTKAADWSRTLKDLSVRLLSVDKTEVMFSQLMVLIEGAVKCDAGAVAISSDDVLSIVSLRGALSPSHNLAAKDIWSYELIGGLKASKNVNVGLAPYGLLETSVKQNELIADYRLDVPVFSKKQLSAVVTLLRQGAEFQEEEIQLVSSMVFHAMISLRLAKYNAAARNSKNSKAHKQEYMLGAASESLILYERKDFIELAKKEFVRARKADRTLSLLLVEVDDYSQIEQRHDATLAQDLLLAIIEICHNACRNGSLIGSYDNGSFALQIPVDLASAKRLAESLRAKVSNRIYRLGNEKLDITVSVGVTTLTDASSDYMSMLRCADMGLFLAKDEKGNAVRVSI